MAENKPDNVIDITPEYLASMRALNQAFSSIRQSSGGTFGISPDGKRDYNALFGYGTDLKYEDFYGMYKRGGVAKTIVDKIAESCWRQIPKITENENEILEDAVKELKSAGLFSALEKADKLNRIGRFSVLVVGVADGNQLEEPLGTANNLTGLWFRTYSEDGTVIKKYDNDPASERFGLPEIYQVSTTNLGDKDQASSQLARDVHWTRIVHLAEGSLDSPVEGCSALEAPWNALIDKDKSRGGSAEAFFRNARRAFAMIAREGATLPTSPEAKQEFKDEVENFMNGWQDFMRLQGFDVNQLPAEIASPRDTFDVAMEEIAGTTGYRVRLLLGKGAGQLAGAEDRASYEAWVDDRQDSFCTGILLRALSIMDDAGLLELPDSAEVEWPPRDVLTEEEDAEATSKRASAFDSVVKGLSTSAGGELDPITVLDAVGLEGIEIDKDDTGVGEDVDQ
jgi:hypothetical protein